VSEKAKLIRGDPPKIALKRRGSPLKIVSEFKKLINKNENIFLFIKHFSL
jgi:hypothetical protein